jgi:hypothetical protein
MQKSYFKFLLFVFFLTTSHLLPAAWTNMNIGIKDDLNGVYFWGNNGLLTGNKGLYYTKTGGSGAAAWKRFNISGNKSDSVIYNNCKFYSITPSATNQSYTCGWDTVNKKAVILYFDIAALTYSFKYIGPVGSKLNSIKYNSDYKHLYAVGDKGLVIWSDLLSFHQDPAVTSKNLYSIDAYSNYVSIGGDSVFLLAWDTNNQLNSIPYKNPSGSIKDINAYVSGRSFGVGDAFYSIGVAGAFTSMRNYDFGKLEGKSIFSFQDGFYVGTSHGIFKCDNSISFLELQPSSASFYINDVWFTNIFATTGYAAGKNGILLKTTDGGGVTKPHASIDLKGACTNGTVTFTGDMGTATSCKWQINNTTVSTDCSYTHVFSSPGTYDISYIVTNATNLADTATQLIHIVDPPVINLPVSVLDPILCKKEKLTISIDHTQTDFLYELKSYKDSMVLTSKPGNGGKITITALPQNENPFYYINVQSLLATCGASFTDSIKIIVEKTKADFHSSLINATPSEVINFSQQCQTAQHYLWNFSPDANIIQDTKADPTGIKFAKPGATTIKLITWSSNGCYDTIIKKGPHILNEPFPNESCWGFNLNGNDAPWVGNYTPDISQQVLTDDGYLICGSHYQDFFTSRRGDSLGRINTGGGFVAKYSKNGILKWVDYGASSTYYDEQSGPRSYVSSVTSDPKSGSIYILGRGRSNEYFHTTDDSVKLIDFTDYYAGYIAKLTPAGNLLWKANLRGYLEVGKIKLDKERNLLVTGTLGGSFNYAMNGKDTFLFDGVHPSGLASYLIKLDTAGAVKWSTYIEHEYHNAGSGIKDYGFDDQHNIFITGGVESSAIFHSANSTSVDTIFIRPSNNGAQLYTVKYNKNGNLQWITSGTIDLKSATANATFLSDGIAVDAGGNSYVTGYNSCGRTLEADSFRIVNADQSLFKAQLGGYFLLKINAAGNVIWANGSKTSYYGVGYGIDIKNNEISVLGIISDLQDPWTGKMSSTNGKDFDFSIGRYDFFIANYNTDGILKSLINTGKNNEAVNFFGNGFSFEKDQSGDYFFSGNIQNYILSPPYTIGHDTIRANGRDGFMARINKMGCGNIITSLEDHTHSLQMDEFYLYPNPMSDHVIIQVRNQLKPYDVLIYNSLGSCVYSKRLAASEFTLNKTEFNSGKSGLYFIKIISADHSLNATKKIVVLD